MEDNGEYDELWTEAGSSYTLGGEWRAEHDGYIINISGNLLEYNDGGWGSGFDGTILEIRKFNRSGTVGIIFIEYNNKPVDFTTGVEPAGNFIGIYFRNLTAATGQFASPIEEFESDQFRTPAKVTLAEAKRTFTQGNTGNYVSYWGSYERQ